MSPASLEGQNLGKYRIMEPLGQGGMARVYRAYHPKLDRYVAIKVLRSDLVSEEEFLARFRREAQAVAGLRNPNIVQVFDFDEQDEIYYMVMELLQGDTLKAYLNSYRSRGEMMPLGDMVKILVDVLDGLSYAHGEGIIHRDIKPANIMLSRRGQAVLTDFGIIQIIGGTNYTISGALMGTLNYMAPEQGLQGKCDARSDLYSVGIVFYEMLIGHTPFDADTPLAILMKHVNDPLPLPCQVNPNVPEPFERVVLKTLSKKPDDRYQNAAEMKQALIAAAGEAGIEIPERVSVSETSPKDAPNSQPVAIFSGTARDKIADAQFAADDTDSSLAARLAGSESSKSTLQAEPPGSIPGVVPLVGAGQSQAGRYTAEPPQARTLNVPEPAADLQQESGLPRGMSVASAGITAATIIVMPNVFAAMFGLVFHNWSFFSYGWPAEILLVALAIAVLMRNLGLIWMLIPVNILASIGILMDFYSITHLWSFWFLWPLEVLVILGSVAVAITIAHDKEHAPSAARTMATIMIVLIIIVLLISLPSYFLLGLIAH